MMARCERNGPQPSASEVANRMDSSSPQSSESVLAESRVAEELGLERMEIYLLASKLKFGQFDTITHLLTFTEAEVDEMARQLGVVRRKHRDPAEADLQSIPEPGAE